MTGRAKEKSVKKRLDEAMVTCCHVSPVKSCYENEDETTLIERIHQDEPDV